MSLPLKIAKKKNNKNIYFCKNITYYVLNSLKIIICIIFLININLSFPFNKKTFKIIGTSLKNENSLSNEVWINEIIVDGKNLDLSKVKLSSGWNYNGNNLFYSSDILSSIDIDIGGKSNIEIYFSKSNWSGITEIKTNKEIFHKDLYTKSLDYPKVKFHYTKSFIQKIIYSFIYAVIYIAIYKILSILEIYSIKIFSNLIKKTNQLNIFQEFSWIILFLPILNWILILIIFWPGLMTPDSFSQWYQANNHTFIISSPVFHTIIISLLQRIWNNPAVVVFFQLIFLYSIFVYFYFVLKKTNLFNIFLTSISISLIPSIYILQITIWKDIPYSISILFLTIMLKIIIEKKFILTKTNYLLLFISLLFTSNFRLNGILVSALVSLVLIIVSAFSKKYKFLIFNIFILTLNLFLFFLPNFLTFYPKTHFFKDKYLSGSTNTILHYLGAYSASGDLIDKSNIFPNIIDSSTIANTFNEYRSDWISFSQKLNIHYVEENKKDINKLFIINLTQKPSIFISSWIKITSLVWKIEPYVSAPRYYYETYFYDLQTNYPTKSQPINNKNVLLLRNNVKKLLNYSCKNTLLVKIFWTPVIHISFILFSFSLLIKKTKKYIYLIVLCPALLNILSLLILVPSQDFRYTFPSLLVLTFIPCIFALKKI